MSIGKWRLLAAILALGLFSSIFIAPGVWGDSGRRAALATQFSPHTTHPGPILIPGLIILVVTAVLGRVYCSLLCPAGLIQELFHRIGAALNIRRLHYAAKPYPAVLLAAAATATAAGLTAAANFLDPLGLFGRLFAVASASASNMALTALLFLGAVLLAAVPLFRGRWFCDRLCPVGALLSLAASAGARGMVIDAEKCVSCGACEALCPARAADAAGRRIDSPRCILCGACADKCPVDAISYRAAGVGGRRGFLRSVCAAAAGGAFLFSRPAATELGVSSGQIPDIAPPGSGGYDRHRDRCVSCQSCVPACPVGIIRLRGADLRPVLDYDRGYCQYDCVACAVACPAGAILPLGAEEKRRTRLAKTRLELARCVVVTNNQACGACAEVCPTHAVRMAEQGEGLPTVPDFDAAYCIGCGACYHVCPSEPRSFVLEGLHQHELAAGVRPGGHSEPEAGPEPADDPGEPQDFPF